MAYGNGGVNSIGARSIYPTAPGQTLGVAASAGSVPDEVEDASSENKTGLAASTGGHPIVWLIVILGILIGLGFLAKRFGTEGAGFSNIKLGFYNSVVIGLAAIVGINVAKVAVNVVPFTPRALRDVVMAA